MTITVNGPNGIIVNFPDGTDRATIDKAMKQAIGQQPPQSPDTVGDVVQSAGSGLATGTMTTLGLPGDAATWVGQGAGWLSGLFGKSAQDQKDVSRFVRQSIPFVGHAPNSTEIKAGVTNATGYKPYVPQTEAGRFANKAASFVPAAATIGLSGGLSAVPLAATAGAFAGATSQAGGNVAATVGGEGARPYGEIAGGLVGGLAPGLARRAVTPFPATPERTAAVTALRNEGVDALTAGQQTGNTGLRYFESEVGGPRVVDTMRTQGEQFTAAALSRAGVNANRATPDVIDTAFTRIGDDFNQLATRNTLVPDPQLRTDVTGAVSGYFRNVSEPSRAPIVVDYLTEIGNAIGANGGRIPGATYQSIRSRLAADARGASDQYVQRALSDLRDALDDSMERSISVTNPGDLGAWTQARQQYRNMLVIERAAAAPGEQAAQGIITPTQLRTATQAVTGRRAYARGNTAFDELARSGVAVMSPLPQSGTAPRAAARTVLGIPALMGAIIGGKTGGGDILATLVGATGGAAASTAARAALMSRYGRGYLANQVLPQNGPVPWQAQATTLGANVTQPYRLPLPPPRMPALGFGR